MLTDKQQSKVKLFLSNLIPDLGNFEINLTKKGNVKLEDELYLELIDILKNKVLEYNYLKFVRITYKQVEKLLDDILNTGKFTQIKINKTYKSIIYNSVLTDFYYISYKNDIIYFKL